MDRFEDTSECEVDHTFYESDFGEEEKKTEENSEYREKGSPKAVLSDPDLIASSKDANCCEEANEEKHADLQKSPFLEDSTGNPGDASFSLLPVHENASTSGATSAASERMQENVPAGSPEINYYTDEEDSSDDDRKQKIRPESAKQSYSVGKASRTYSTTSSSSSSSSSDTDSDSSLSDSPHSSSRRNACSVALPSPKQKCASIKLPEGKPKLGDHVEESKDAESKSDFSSDGLHDGMDLNQHLKAALQLENEEQHKQTAGHPSGRTRESFSANKEVQYRSDLKAALELRDKRPRKLGIIHPVRSTRKNYSFTNEEVRRIDQENHRLLQELARLCTTPGNRTNMLKKSASPSLPVYHSAINRQKEQQRIEKENLALLKRLTAVKPTPGMKRSEQLWDYQRYVGYASTSPAPREESSLSRQRGLSRVSSRAYTASSTVRQKEKPTSVSPTVVSQRPKSTNVHAACLKCKQHP